jgi:N6-adenosine-specific RNA methylase IME4
VNNQANKPYSVLLLDPPWAYRNFSHAKNGAAKAHYSQLTIGDLAKLDMSSLCDKDAMIFMWATMPKLDIAFELIQTWGFEYVTSRSWFKTYADGSHYMGVGHHCRNDMEVLLICRKGKGLKRVESYVRKLRQSIQAPVVRPHSTKPTQFRDDIVQSYEGTDRRLELFARTKGPGWDATGHELDNTDIRDFIENFKKCQTTSQS